METIAKRDYADFLEKRSEKEPTTTAAQTTTLPPLKETGIKNTSLSGLLVLYWLSKTYKSKKASSLKIFSEVMKYDEGGKSYALGYLLGTQCNLRHLEISVNEDTLCAEGISNGFAELVTSTITERLDQLENQDDPDRYQRLKASFEQSIRSVDAYFGD